jgi:hypothetical protein
VPVELKVTGKGVLIVDDEIVAPVNAQVTWVEGVIFVLF